MIIDYFYPRRDIIIENFMASSLVKENLDQEAKLLCLREWTIFLKTTRNYRETAFLVHLFDLKLQSSNMKQKSYIYSINFTISYS